MAVAPRECRARVSAVRTLAPEVLEADLDMTEPSTLAFEAGQWISVPFGPKQVRAYSIASSPRSAGRLTLCADVAPDGLGSRWFRGLAPGADVRFKGPLGGFVLPPGEMRPLLFVADEIGIVPVRAIVAELAPGRPATLIYGAPDARRPYDGELRERARSGRGFAYHPVSEDDVAGAVERLGSRDSGVVAYVAGGEATIKRVREILMARGLERKAIKWERFW
jgi:CDP-4-dehydro-6-deoxyglucose reductase